MTSEIAVHDSPLKAAVWQVYDSIFSENQGKLAGGVRQSRRRYAAGNRLLSKPLPLWKYCMTDVLSVSPDEGPRLETPAIQSFYGGNSSFLVSLLAEVSFLFAFAGLRSMGKDLSLRWSKLTLYQLLSAALDTRTSVFKPRAPCYVCWLWLEPAVSCTFRNSNSTVVKWAHTIWSITRGFGR